MQLLLQSLQIEEQRKWFNGLTSVNNITKITESLIFWSTSLSLAIYLYIFLQLTFNIVELLLCFE